MQYRTRSLQRWLTKIGDVERDDGDDVRPPLPCIGLSLILDGVSCALGAELYELLLQLVSFVLILRPNTVFGFSSEYGVRVLRVGRTVVIVAYLQYVKRHPEFVVNPKRMEVPVSSSGPLAVLALGIERAAAEDPDWFMQLHIAATVKTCASVVSKRLRRTCSRGQLGMGANEQLSSYCLRIAWATVLAMVCGDMEFVRQRLLWSPWTVGLRGDGQAVRPRGLCPVCRSR